MPRYVDFKSYIQANYEELLKEEISKFVDKYHDGLGFHSINVISLCDQKIENIKVKSITCHDDIGPLIRVNIHASADIVSMGLGSSKYEADRKTRWFTVNMQAVLKNGLHNIVILGTEEYNPGRFEKQDAFDEYLLPYIYADDLEDQADDFFMFYCQNAIYHEWVLPIENILSEMGIYYYEAPLPENVFGRMYFRPSVVEVYEEIPPNFRAFIKKEKSLTEKKINSGTMLINKNNFFMHNVGSALNTIAHEIVHWEKHQKFFEILALLNDEEDKLSCEVDPQMKPDNLEGVQKAIWWAEWQANALAPRILMPRLLFVDLFEKTYSEQAQTPYHYSGEIMERTIERIAHCFGVSRYAAKIRALQLGYKTAEGALLNIDGHYHSPFTFNPTCLADYRTFVIDRKNFDRLRTSNKHLNDLIDAGKFVYTGCVVCINDPLYVTHSKERFAPTEYKLTSYALEHVDECCLVFKRNYSTKDSAGDFYNQCYLSKDINAAAFSEIKEIDFEDNQNVETRAVELTKLKDEGIRIMDIYRSLPMSFAGTLDAHMKRLFKEDGRKMTNLELALRTGLSDRYIQDLRKGDKNVSFVNVCSICIGLHLHPIFSNDLIKKSRNDYPMNEEGFFNRFLIEHHYMDTLELCNEKLAELGYRTWGKEF